MHKTISRRSLLALLAGSTAVLAAPVLAQTSYYIPAGTALAQSMAAVQPVSNASLIGSGSGFGGPLYKKWSEGFFTTGPGLKYESNGSGAGVSQFSAGVTDLGGSDVPMTDNDIQNVRGNNRDVLQIPTAYGGIVVTYNLPGGLKLNLTGEKLAQIYLGQITRWNDSALVADNPQLANVDQDIITFHRADASGTTYGFTSYLDESSKAWRGVSGSGFAVYWKVGTYRRSNQLIVDSVKNNPYSLGYADYNFVVAQKMPMASLQNKTGQFIQPTPASIGAAITAAVNGASDDLRLKLINAPGQGAYPLVTATYLIVHQHQANDEKARTIKAFLSYGMKEGQAIEAGLNYVPLPAEVVQKALRLINSIDGNSAANK